MLPAWCLAGCCVPALLLAVFSVTVTICDDVDHQPHRHGHRTAATTVYLLAVTTVTAAAVAYG